VTTGTTQGVSNAATLVDYAKSLDCIHCGLCLHTCPTYRLTGAEPSSPRGRIHLMRAVAEERLEADDAFANEMDFCLVCRHCESVCPAGVEFGAMMEFTRDQLIERQPQSLFKRLARQVGLRWVLPSRRWTRFAVSLLRFAQRTRLVRLVAPLFGERGRALASFPSVPPAGERSRVPSTTPTGGVWLLEGCVMPELFGRVNHATSRLLASVGLGVRTSNEHVCCGALHAHNGDLSEARKLARATISAFEDAADAPVVLNSAGCGAHMKEYGRLLAEDADWCERAQAFADRVVDLSELLCESRYREQLAAKLKRSPARRLTYDDPCHLCHGQSVRSQPRELLDLLPDIERTELTDSESCCGSAGIYSLLRPADSNRILDAKLDALRASGASVLVTANPGCHLQWQSGIERAGLDIEVKHLAEVLDEALGD